MTGMLHTGKRGLAVGGLATVVALILLEVWAASHLLAVERPALLGAAITFDLVVLLPVAVWALFVRTRCIGRWVLLPTLLIGYGLSHVLVRGPHDAGPRFVEAALPNSSSWPWSVSSPSTPYESCAAGWPTAGQRDHDRRLDRRADAH